jgi:endonuclease G
MFKFDAAAKFRVVSFILVAVTVVFSAMPLCAGTTGCPSHYVNGMAPDIRSAQLAVKTQELCFDSFGVLHSGISRTSLWSAEHLTRANLAQAKGLKRENSFHPEEQLPADERAALRDYARSGYDRGHMSPSADMPTAHAQWQSFSLGNMVPQNSDNNRNLWEGIESAVRTLAKRTGELYVITGPLFIGDSLQRLNGRVLVPTHLYKVVFDPHQGMGAAYLVKNEPGMAWQAVSISYVEELAGITFFPGFSNEAKQRMLELPEPTPHSNHGGHHRNSTAGGALRSLFR